MCDRCAPGPLLFIAAHARAMGHPRVDSRLRFRGVGSDVYSRRGAAGASVASARASVTPCKSQSDHTAPRPRAAVVRLLSVKPKRKTVLLCGPMGGGATTLWHALQQHPLPHGTVTSMQENDAICAPIPVRPPPCVC